MHRGPFEDALTWLEIHGSAPEALEHWKGFIEALGDEAKHPPAEGEAAALRRRAAAAPPAAGAGAAAGAAFKPPPAH